MRRRMNAGTDDEDAEDDLHEEDLPEASRPTRSFPSGTAPDRPPAETGGAFGEQRWKEGLPLVVQPTGGPASLVLPPGHGSRRKWSPPAGRELFDKTEQRMHEVRALSRPSFDWIMATSFVRQHHYSHSLPNLQRSIVHGMYDQRREPNLVGVAIYSIPGGSGRSIEMVFPGGIDEALELSRFILLPSVKFGGESWFLSRSRELLLKEGLRGFTSFSDPHEWTGFGQVTPGNFGEVVVKPGHYGQIYQASGLAYLGAGKREKFWFMPDWRLIPPYSLSKIRTGKSGWMNNVRRLVALGARPPRCLASGVHDEEELRAWVDRWLPRIGARQIMAPGKHKFAFTVDPQDEREIRRIRRSVMVPSPSGETKTPIELIRPWSPEPVVFPYPAGRDVWPVSGKRVAGLKRYGEEYPRKPTTPERGRIVDEP